MSLSSLNNNSAHYITEKDIQRLFISSVQPCAFSAFLLGLELCAFQFKLISLIWHAHICPSSTLCQRSGNWQNRAYRIHYSSVLARSSVLLLENIYVALLRILFTQQHFCWDMGLFVNVTHYAGFLETLGIPCFWPNEADVWTDDKFYKSWSNMQGMLNACWRDITLRRRGLHRNDACRNSWEEMLGGL